MPGSTPDGRRGRREKNARAVARAMLDLMRETGDVPSAEAVAARAGVSRRSVFRLFKDVETLSRTANELQQAEVMERFMPPPMPEGDVHARVDALVAHRAGIYEHIMPVRRIAERRRWHEPVVEADLMRTREAFRAHVEVMFADLAPDDRRARRELFDALELATSWQSWHVLRNEQGCSVARARRVVSATLRALLERLRQE